MPSDIKLSNVIGAPFSDFVLQQLAIRANRNSGLTRNNEDVLFLANKSAWVRLVSSVNIQGDDVERKKFYESLKISLSNTDPEGLAQNWILQAGTSIQSGNGVILRQGIGLENNAYGLGGIEELGFRPMPGLTSVQVETLGRLGSLRQATISFKVWNMNQLNVIEALYFRLGYFMLLEWGHTQYFANVDAKNNFTPDGTFKSNEIYGINDPFSSNYRKETILTEIGKKVKSSFGNYDGMLGLVSNFTWAFNQEGGYDCTVRIVGPGGIMDSIRINQSFQLPEGEVKRYLRNQEIIERALAEQAARQKLLEQRLAEVNAAGPDPTKQAVLPPEPKTLGQLQDYLKKYDGFANPSDLDALLKYYGIYGIEEIRSRNGRSPLIVLVPYPFYVTFTNSNNSTTVEPPDVRKLVNEAYRGLYSFGDSNFNSNTPVYNISPGRNNSRNVKPNVSLINNFVSQTEAITQFNSFGELHNFDTQADLKKKAEDEVDNSRFKNIFNNYLTYWLLFRTRYINIIQGEGTDEEGIVGGKAVGLNEQLKLEYDKSTGVGSTLRTSTYNKAAATFSLTTPDVFVNDINVTLNSYSAFLKVTIEVPPDSINETFPITRGIALSGLSTALSSGNFELKVDSVSTANHRATIKATGTLLLKGVPYVGTNPNNANDTRDLPISIIIETNNPTFFLPSTPPTTTTVTANAAGTGNSGNTSGTTNTPGEQATQQSDGFQSALHAMLTIVQADVQANANKKEKIAVRSIDKDPDYRKIVDGFFAKGILAGVLNAGPSDPLELRYAKKGFNTSMMLDPTLYSKVEDVDFAHLTKAFIIRYPRNGLDGVKDTVRCPVYISFGYLLAFLVNMCLVYDSTRRLRDVAPTGGSTDAGKRPYFYIDFNPKTNLCLTFPLQFSVDPFVCMIPFAATNDQYKSLYPNTITLPSATAFNPQKTNKVSEKLQTEGYEFVYENANQGRIMDILLNVDYLLDLLSEYQYSDPEHAVNFQPYVERILVDIGKSLGNANYFKLVYRDDANTVQIVDYQWTPNLANEPSMTDAKLFNQKARSQDLYTRIVSGELPVFGDQSLAREFQLKTTISTRLASYIAISASPETGSINSKDHSSFSTLNSLYLDRYKKYPQDAGNSITTTNANSKVKSNDQTAAILFDTHVSHIYSNFELAKSDVELAKNYYIERISKVKAGDPVIAAAAPIPANLEITLDGISGIIMYNAFTIPQDRLPISLRGINGNARFGFITSGLVHTIENNQWLTKLTGQMFPLREYSSLGKAALISGPQTSVPGIGGTTDAILQNIGGPCERRYENAVQDAIRNKPGFNLLKTALANNGYSSKIALAAILAIAGGETGWQAVDEDYGYSNQQIKSWFALNNDQIDRAIAARDRGDRLEVFRIIYGERPVNGNTGREDGAKYYGRGFIQFTGRGVYKAIGDAIGVDLVSKPELAGGATDISARATVAYYNITLKANGVDINDSDFMAKAIKATGNIVDAGIVERKIGYYNCILGLI